METCDRCGPAVAAHVYVMVGEIELRYCNHCKNRFLDAWLERGYHVTIDTRGADVSPVDEDN